MTHQAIRVAVLACGAGGRETARVLAELPEVSRATLVRAPSPGPKGLWARVRRSFRRHGPTGPLRALLRRLRSSGRRPPSDFEGHEISVGSFHDEQGLPALEALDADLFVLDGTYILPESVFGMPRLGTINLHCGYLPDFKGAPPVFWELYEGRDESGVSVHFVTADLDGGPIIERRKVAIDPAPPGDPVAYADAVWRNVLRPAGLEMLADAVRSLARGQVETIPQTGDAGRMFRHPSYRQVKELRRRVAARRAAG